ncbi:MAG: cadherin-like domain-containing protein, partial [Planctomycetota bacterium]
SVTNNISSGSSGHGIIIWSDGLVEHDLGAESGRTTVKTANIPNGNLITGRDEIPVWWAPLAEVSNNEVSNAVIGFRTRYIHSNGYVGEGGSAFHASPDQAYIDTLNPEIDGLKVWGSREGVYLNYSERMSLKNAEIIGIGEAFVYQEGTTNVGVGLDLANQISRGSGRLENVTIEGFGMGIMAPRNEQWVMDNITLRNTTDMMIEEPRLSPRALTMANFTFGSLDGTAVSGTAGQRRNIDFRQTDFTSGDGQPFFFLLPDHITMDGQGLYSNSQNGNFVPLQEAPDGNPIMQVPQSYVGKTNQQLQNQFGLSFGGNVTPSNAQNANWIRGGRLGSAMDAATNFPQLWDMTNGGENREPPKGGPVPELTGNRLEISSGQTVTFMNSNLNTTDTNTGFAGLTYTVSQIQNGYFAHRNSPTTPIASFTQAQVNGGVVRFVHDGSNNAPDYRVTVSDGTTTTSASSPVVRFNGDGGSNQLQEIGYSGVANAVSHQWKKITLPRSFSNPVVIAGGATRNGGHQGVVRIRNVSSNSFEIRFQEWDYLDGQHAFEDISYLVLEAGAHELTDGTRIVAGTVSAQHENFSSVSFDGSFNTTPLVISQIMTNNGGAAATDRLRNVTASGFEIQMQEEEAADHLHNEETLGWIAIDQGIASSGDTMLNAIRTDGVNHRNSTIPLNLPGGGLVVLTDMQTRAGSDPATVRHRSQNSSSVTVFLEEEKSANNEVQHIREAVGTLALQPGMLFATTAGDGDNSSRPADSGPSENGSQIALSQFPLSQKSKAGTTAAGDDLKSRLDALVNADAVAGLSGSLTSIDSVGDDSTLLNRLPAGGEVSGAIAGENLDLLDESFESFS